MKDNKTKMKTSKHLLAGELFQFRHKLKTQTMEKCLRCAGIMCKTFKNSINIFCQDTNSKTAKYEF